MILQPSRSTLFPYTTLFRSTVGGGRHPGFGLQHLRRPPVDLARELRGRTRRSEEHTSELQSHSELVCRLLLEKKNISITARRLPSARIRHTHNSRLNLTTLK